MISNHFFRNSQISKESLRKRIIVAYRQVKVFMCFIKLLCLKKQFPFLRI